MGSVPERSEIDDEYKWDLERVYGSEAEWEADCESIEAQIEELVDYEGRATEDGGTLLELLEAYQRLLRDVDKVGAYARMRGAEDTRDQEARKRYSKAEALIAEARSAVSFMVPELQRLDHDDLAQLIDEEPGLEPYEHYLEDVLRMKEHTAPEEAEQLLANLSDVLDTPGEVYGVLTEADLSFPSVEDPDGDTVKLTKANFVTLLKRPERSFRRDVYERYYDRWADVRNTVATTYEKSVRADVTLARERGYETAREASLDGPNVPIEVYETLVETVRANLDPLHRHLELKREARGLDDLRMWDLYAPSVPSEKPTVEYETASEHVVSALGALGDDYQARVAEAIDSRWIDVYANEGKRSGSYTGGAYDTTPYIIMNYQDDISSMYTLAHELGHAMHRYLTHQHQPYVYSDFEVFVAEVASTVNEVLLTDHLLETVDDPEFRRHVLDEYLERFRSTLYRQTMFADFEHRIHRIVEEGGALTPDEIDETYRNLKAAFYEPAVLDDRIAREWMRVPHFYRGYYVFQYGTGIAAAAALARDVRRQGERSVDRYLELLAKGCREYPLELLDRAGVDMRTADPVRAAVREYAETLDEFEAVL